MPRVTFRDDVYERKTSTSLTEKDFENLISSRGMQLFPRWTVVSFSAPVSNPEGVIKKPDLALIDPEYREWWIVEVELEHHDFNNHVFPQVEVFTRASYTTEHAEWIIDRNPSLDKQRLKYMMLGEPPRVLVIVDSLSTNWDNKLREIGASLMIVEPFQNSNGEILTRINGIQPEPKGDILTICKRDFTLRRFWRVESPAALPQFDKPLRIEYEDTNSIWQITETKGIVYLSSERGERLPSSVNSVSLLRRSDGSLQFIANQNKRRSKWK